MKEKSNGVIDLSNKIAVITGMNGGIGNAIGKLFHECGAKVIGLVRNTDNEEPFAEYYLCDVSNRDECQTNFEKVIAKYNKIDILVNCAGITRDSLTQNMTEEEFDDVINVNLKGVWNITSLFGPYMRKQKFGSIINISSVVGLYGNIGQANYAASKAGIIGLTKTWAKEFAFKDSNVRVNAIAPGYTYTGMIETVPKELLDKFAGQTMLGRLAQPEEIANAVLFLASDLSSYITGTVLSVDGGMRL